MCIRLTYNYICLKPTGFSVNLPTNRYMKSLPPSPLDIKRLLPRGAISQLSAELGLSTDAVRKALEVGKPGHPVVQRAIKMAIKSGAFATAQALARLQPTR